MKKKAIRKKFTSKEDEILLNIMLQSKTKTTGFKEASEKLNRSLNSIKSRWYHVTIFQYDKIKDNPSKESVNIIKTAKTNSIGEGFINILTTIKNLFVKK